jgi:RecB family exonuclease
LGWDAPVLPRAVDFLCERFTIKTACDLSGTICVLPSSRGVQRFKQLLSCEMESRGLQYSPPRIITIGQLAECLHTLEIPVALEIEQTLAWASVLRTEDPEQLKPLFPIIPAPEPVGAWLDLASTMRRLHEDLSANEMTFRSVVDVTETDSEKRRWELLSGLFDQYLATLSGAGVCDPHWARRDAVLQGTCHAQGKVVLVGTSDLSNAMVAMLRAQDEDLISLIAAPESDSWRFDEFGCVETKGWLEHHLPLQDEQLISAGDVADQAMAVAASLADLGDQFSIDQVTVGVTDESQVGPVEIELRGCGVGTKRNLGWPISQTAVGRLLQLTSTFLQRRNWQSLASLVRHADVARYITKQLDQVTTSDWLTELDRLLSNHYPIKTRDALSPKAMKAYPQASEALKVIETWLAEFMGAERSIAQWSSVIEEWLEVLYGEVNGDKSDEVEIREGTNEVIAQESKEFDSSVVPSTVSPTRTQRAFEAVKRLTQRFETLNANLDLIVTGSAALEMLSGRLADARVSDQGDVNDIAILGWLDLALDDSAAMVVVGLNHPFVPGAVTSDPFLPGALRSKLRMSDNERRYARDLYAMHVMLSSRDSIKFIVGRRAADQTPTPPSRLLAATEPTHAARRVRNLLDGPQDSVLVQHGWDQTIDGRELAIPTLPELGDIGRVRTMSVTAFRDYLDCPYRFYLRHVLKLRPMDDATGELAANQFGDMVHGALETFGDSADRDETDVGKIEEALLSHLSDYVAQHYGSAVSSAVTLQVAQAERRLKAVAKQQAARIAQGWTIHASEAAVNENDGAGIEVDGMTMGLRGRFDRIDFHEQTGRYAILDYKTHGHRPEKKHLKKVDGVYQWIDLQLPLYRMMVPFLGIKEDPATVELGYFNISEKDEETKINIAEFTEEQMAEAVEIIEGCVRGIWAERFEPTAERVQYDDYDMILQSGVARRLANEVEGSVEKVQR